MRYGLNTAIFLQDDRVGPYPQPAEWTLIPMGWVVITAPDDASAFMLWRSRKNDLWTRGRVVA